MGPGYNKKYQFALTTLITFLLKRYEKIEKKEGELLK